MPTFYIFIIISQILRICYAEPELKLVNIIFRHGDRTPTENAMFPKDPYYNYDFYPYGKGALTNLGKSRTYKLGEFLRERYKNFLGDIYLPELVHAQSSDYDRTKMSLQIVLAALFPPSNIQKWHETLNWQPIPMTYIPKKYDDLLVSVYQSKFTMEKSRIEALGDIQKRLKNYHGFMHQLSNLTGKNISDSFSMKSIYDTFTSESFMNLTLPDWANEIFPDGKLLEGALLNFDICSYDNNVTSALTGKLMLKISSDIKEAAKQAQKVKTKIFLYSCHDINIIGVLRALNVLKIHVPEYSSAIIIELFEENNEHFIKIIYYQGVRQDFSELQIPECDVLCPLKKYLENLDDILKLVNDE